MKNVIFESFFSLCCYSALFFVYQFFGLKEAIPQSPSDVKRDLFAAKREDGGVLNNWEF